MSTTLFLARRSAPNSQLAPGLVLLVLLLLPGWATAAGEGGSPSKPPAAPRMKAIDFEDDLVEGLNKRPLDSLQSLKDQQKRRRSQALYRKRMSYKTEIFETIRQQAEGSQP